MLLELKNVNHFKIFSNNQIVSNILNQNRKLKTLIFFTKFNTPYY